MDIQEIFKSTTYTSQYKFIKQIGSGTFGEVVLATKKNDLKNQPVAIKIVKEKMTKGKLSAVLKEHMILEKCKQNPFIVQIKDFHKDKNYSFFAMEHVSGGELFDIIQSKGHFSEDATRFYASQVILALEHLHNNDIVYRDLKTENILLDQNGYIKLIDFGLSEIEVTSSNLTQVCGTFEYVSPEMLYETGYGKQIDHWSLGVLIYEMITGYTPFDAETQKEIFQKIKQSKVCYPSHISPQLKSLLEGLLTKYPTKRLGFKGFEQIKKHPWFMKTNWEQLQKKTLKDPFKMLVNKQVGRESFDSSNSDLDNVHYQTDGSSQSVSLNGSF